MENTSLISPKPAREAAGTGVRVVRVDSRIIHTAFVRIGQHIVGVVHFLELVLELRARDVGGGTYG